MLAQIRRFVKSPWATGLLALIALSFVGFGMRGVFNAAAPSDAVLKVGGRETTAKSFRQMFDRYLQSVAQQNGGKAPTVSEAAAQGLDARALNEVAYEESVSALATHLGVRPSDALVAAELRKAKQFFDPITGKFDEKAYKTFLRQNDTTAEELEGSIRDQIAQQHLLTGLVAGLKAPFAYTAVQAAYNSERRAFSYILLGPGAVPTPPPPTDAELQAVMKANAQAFMRPEVRTVSLVRFSATLLAPTITPDPTQMQKRFDFEKDSLSTPEKRAFVQIPVKSAADAGAAAARLAKGDDAVAVARAYGANVVAQPPSPASAIPDRAVADAVFALKPGEARAVAGALGASAVKLTTVEPGKAVTLDQVRPKIEEEVRKAAAAQKAQELAAKYAELKAGGSNLHDAATKAGVAVTVLPPFTAKGMDAHGQHVPAPQKLVDTAYALPAGGESDVLAVEGAPGEFYAIRVETVEPPAPIPLAEIKPFLVQRLTVQKLATALQAKAQGLVAQAAKDGNLDGAAKAAGVPVQHAADVQRAAKPGEEAQGFGPRLLGAVFAAKPGAVFAAPEKQAVLVARLDSVSQPPLAELVQASAAATGPATLGLYDDTASHLREAARVEMKPRLDAKKARAALGLPDAPVAAAPAPAPAR